MFECFYIQHKSDFSSIIMCSHTYPENIIEKQASKQNNTCANLVKLQKFNSIHTEGQTNYVVSYPMLKNKYICISKDTITLTI